MAEDTDVDADLIRAVRAGDLLAYDRLFRRHLPAARRVAGMMWRDRAEVDDLVAESFLRVFAAIRDGAGPAERFRPYLLVTLRNLAMDWGRRRERCDPWAAARDERAPGVEEIVIDRLTGEVAKSAFETLPPRWRYVLWHTEMLGTGPGKLAGELGMTANGVAALAVRAREGLRQAFLQAHVPATGAEECRTVRRRLGAWTRGKVTARQGRAVSAHLAQCPKCHRVAAALETVNGGIPALTLVPLVGRLLGGSGAPTASVAAGGAAISKVAAAVTLAAVVAVTGPVVAPAGVEPAGHAPEAVAAPVVPTRAGPAWPVAPDQGAERSAGPENSPGQAAAEGNGAAKGAGSGDTWGNGLAQANGGTSAPGQAKAEEHRPPKPQSDAAQSEKPQSDRAQTDRAQSDRAQSDRAQSDRAQSGKAQSGRAQSGRAQSGKAQSGKAQSGKAQSDLAQSDLAQSGKAQSGKAQSEKAQPEKAQPNSQSAKPQSDTRPERAQPEKPQPDKPLPEKAHGSPRK